MSARRSRRGQPVMVLGALLASWMGVRAALWESPFDIPAMAQGPVLGELVGTFNRALSAASPAPAGLNAAGAATAQREPRPSSLHERPLVERPLPGLVPASLPVAPPTAPEPWADAYRAHFSAIPADGEPAPSRARMAVGHAMLSMLGLSSLDVPPVMAAYVDIARGGRGAAGARTNRNAVAAGGGSAGPALAPVPGPRRWSGDSWLVLREDSAAPVPASRPSYGRSQVGAVIRYRLKPSSGHDPRAYARASAAIERPRDAELAAGLGARPLPRVPIRLAAELRLADAAQGAELRPAAMAVTEIPPFALPLGLNGEVYAQGGYVGGEYETAFVDGQARATGLVARMGKARVDAGAGLWGGAQKNVERLDVGPSASVSFSIGDVYSRVAVDYRVRVAGEARPASGPALTLAAGF